MKKISLKPPTAIPPFRIELGSGFLLLFAFIYFFDESGLLASLFPVVLVHEAGHILAMLYFGAYPTRLRATLSGFTMDYSGDTNEKQEMLVALAGPAFGFAFSVLCARLGQHLDSEGLLMCAGLGFVLNVFNLLPTLSLDGGRILIYFLRAAFGAERAPRILRIVGLVTVFLLLAIGLYNISDGHGFSLFVAGIWLFVLQWNSLVNKS
jgi:stage IV sporulation protein FB